MSEKPLPKKNAADPNLMMEEINVRFKVLEESILTLRQDLRDNFGQMEARLENLRARMAEIQTVLIEWREERPFGIRNTRHN